MDTTKDSTRSKFYGWTNVVFLFLIYSVITGFVLYGFTVIFPAMIQAQGWGRGEASLAHTIRGLVVGFMIPLAAFCLGKIGARKTLHTGLIVATITLILLGTVTTQLWQWTLIWGFIMPIGFALGGYLPVLTTINFWFNRRRAMTTGIVMTGGSIAGFVGAPFYTLIIKKTGSWETAWLAAAGFCVLAFIASLFIKNTPQELGQHPDGIDPDKVSGIDTTGKTQPTGVYQTSEVWPLKEVLRTRVMWFQIVCMISTAWGSYMMLVHGILHFTDMGLSHMQAASVISTFILFNGISRFPTGILADRIEPRILTTFAILGMGLTIIVLWKVPQNFTLLLTISGISGFCFGVTAITYPMLSVNYFSPDTFPSINGFFAPIMLMASAPVPVVAGLIFDHYKSYDMAFLPITILLFIASIFAWFLYPPQKRHKIISTRNDEKSIME